MLLKEKNLGSSPHLLKAHLHLLWGVLVALSLITHWVIQSALSITMISSDDCHNSKKMVMSMSSHSILERHKRSNRMLMAHPNFFSSSFQTFPKRCT